MCLPAAGRDCGIKNPLSLLPLEREDSPCGVEDFTPQGKGGGEGRTHEDRRKNLEIWI
jgi:hypothetical protein